MLDSALKQSRQQGHRRQTSAALQRSSSAPLQRFFVPTTGRANCYHLTAKCCSLRDVGSMRASCTEGRRLCMACAKEAAAKPITLYHLDPASVPTLRPRSRWHSPDAAKTTPPTAATAPVRRCSVLIEPVQLHWNTMPTTVSTPWARSGGGSSYGGGASTTCAQAAAALAAAAPPPHAASTTIQAD